MYAVGAGGKVLRFAQDDGEGGVRLALRWSIAGGPPAPLSGDGAVLFCGGGGLGWLFAKGGGFGYFIYRGVEG